MLTIEYKDDFLKRISKNSTYHTFSYVSFLAKGVFTI